MRDPVSVAIASILLLLVACDRAPHRLDSPDILLIIGDDVGYTDYGFMGSEYVETPRLDRLAAEGTVFKQGYVTASTCRASLRSLLTGLDPYQWDLRVRADARHGIHRSREEEIQSFTTLPTLLATRGYVSFEGGKFWEATYRIAGFSDGMETTGKGARTGGAGRKLGRTDMDPLYQFIESNRDRPFFVWFAPMLPHIPFDAPARFRQPYEGSNLSDAAVDYYANVTRLDSVVGELLDFLDSQGLRRDTLVVYLADNGWDQGPQNGRPASPIGVDDGPRGKATLYELGFRTPIVLRWPGVVPAGEVLNQLVSSLDLFPSLLDFAGVEVPSWLPGRTLRPLLRGESSAAPRVLVGGMPNVQDPDSHNLILGFSFYVRTEHWHYVQYASSHREELYDVQDDPGERRDVSRDNPLLVEQMRRTIEDWRRGLQQSPAS